MDPMDRTAVVAALEASLRHLERVVSRLDEAKATVRPTPERWSPMETLEHLVVVERGIHKSVTAASGAAATDLRTRQMDSVIAGAGTVTRALVAPDVVAPTGRFHSVHEALVLFRERRITTINLARTLDVPWDAHHMTHPILGPLDIGHWFLLAATHVARHLPQIEV